MECSHAPRWNWSGSRSRRRPPSSPLEFRSLEARSRQARVSRAGGVLYDGEMSAPFGDGFWVVPLRALWEDLSATGNPAAGRLAHCQPPPALNMPRRLEPPIRIPSPPAAGFRNPQAPLAVYLRRYSSRHAVEFPGPTVSGP